MAGILGKILAARLASALDIAPGAVDQTKLATGIGQAITTVIGGSTNITIAMAGLIIVDATSGNVTINLPTASALVTFPLTYKFVRIDNTLNTVIINRNGGDVIDTGPSLVLSGKFDNVVIMSDGISTWRVENNLYRYNGRKNLLMNANFHFWQRNTTFSATGYTADRWRFALGTGGSPAATVTRQAFTPGQTAVPNEPTYFMQIAHTAAATSTGSSIEQRIEGVRAAAGKNITISSYGAVASSTISIGITITQFFGTGGSPSSSVVSSSLPMIFGTTLTRQSVTFPVPSITGKTLGTNGDDYLAITFTLPISSTFTFSMAQAQTEIGSLPTSYEFVPYTQVLTDCKRYYEKSYDSGIVPGTASTPSGSLYTTPNYTTGVYTLGVRYTVEKRAIPSTVTFYNPNSGATGSGRGSSAADRTATIVNTAGISTSGMNGFALSLAAVAAAETVGIHYTADAEL